MKDSLQSSQLNCSASSVNGAIDQPSGDRQKRFFAIRLSDRRLTNHVQIRFPRCRAYWHLYTGQQKNVSPLRASVSRSLTVENSPPNRSFSINCHFGLSQAAWGNHFFSFRSLSPYFSWTSLEVCCLHKVQVKSLLNDVGILHLRAVSYSSIPDCKAQSTGSQLLPWITQHQGCCHQYHLVQGRTL